MCCLFVWFTFLNISPEKDRTEDFSFLNFEKEEGLALANFLDIKWKYEWLWLSLLENLCRRWCQPFFFVKKFLTKLKREARSYVWGPDVLKHVCVPFLYVFYKCVCHVMLVSKAVKDHFHSIHLNLQSHSTKCQKNPNVWSTTTS